MTKALFWLSIFVLTAFSTVAQPNLRYVVRFRVNTHYAEVELTISGLNESVTTVHLPVWTPGSYLVREFARNIDSFSASVDGKPCRAARSARVAGKSTMVAPKLDRSLPQLCARTHRSYQFCRC